MEKTPLTSGVEIEGRSFRVESIAVPARGRIQSSVTSEGRVISQREIEIPEHLDEEGLARFLQEVHRSRAVELEAVFRLSRKIEEKPTADACSKIGVVLLSNGFYGDALQKFQKALELEPGNLYALKHYGICLALQEDYEAAVAAFHEAQRLGPDYADLHYHLGNIHLYRRELDEAVEEYRRALAINPRYADARLRLATAYAGYLAHQQDQLPAGRLLHFQQLAHEESETAAQVNPKLRNRSFLLAQDYLRNKKYSLAFQHFLDARPKYVPRIGDEITFFFMLTLLYGSEGIDLSMTEGYIEKLARVIQEYPQYADLHHHLAVALLIRARFDLNRSGRELRRALEINPNYAQAAGVVGEVGEVHQKLLEVLRKALFENK